MKTRSTPRQPAREYSISMRAIFVATCLFAVAFWLATGSSGQAGGTCTVCHKRTQTLTFPCNFSEYFRHLDHGDPPGGCNTPMALEPRTSDRLNLGVATAVESGNN